MLFLRFLALYCFWSFSDAISPSNSNFKSIVIGCIESGDFVSGSVSPGLCHNYFIHVFEQGYSLMVDLNTTGGVPFLLVKESPVIGDPSGSENNHASYYQFKSQGEVHGVVVKSDYLSPGRWYVGVCNYETREPKTGISVSAISSDSDSKNFAPTMIQPQQHECVYNFRTVLLDSGDKPSLSEFEDQVPVVEEPVQETPEIEPPAPTPKRKQNQDIRRPSTPAPTAAPATQKPAPTPTPAPTKKAEEARPAISGKSLKLLGNLQTLVELPLSSRVPDKIKGLPPTANDEQISETLSQTLKHVQQLRGELLNSNTQSEAWQTKISKLHSDLSQSRDELLKAREELDSMWLKQTSERERVSHELQTWQEEARRLQSRLLSTTEQLKENESDIARLSTGLSRSWIAIVAILTLVISIVVISIFRSDLLPFIPSRSVVCHSKGVDCDLMPTAPPHHTGELKRVYRELEGVKKEVETEKSARESAESKLKNVAATLDKEQKARQAAEAQQKLMSEKVEALSGEAGKKSATDKQLAENRKMLEKRVKECESLRQEVEASRVKLESALQELGAVGKTSDTTKREIEVLKRDLESSRRDAESSKLHLEQMRKELSLSSDGQRREFDQQRKAAAAKQAELETERDSIRAELKKLEDQNKSLRATIAAEAKKPVVPQVCPGTCKHVEQLNTKLKSSEEQLKSSKDKLEKVQAQEKAASADARKLKQAQADATQWRTRAQQLEQRLQSSTKTDESELMAAKLWVDILRGIGIERLPLPELERVLLEQETGLRRVRGAIQLRQEEETGIAFFSSPPGTSKKLASDRNTCRICEDRDATMIVLPCGDISLCRSCSESVSQCPKCRGDVEAVESMETWD